MSSKVAAPSAGEPGQSGGHLHARGARDPSVAHRTPVAHVQCDGERRAAVCAHEPPDERRIAERGGAHDRAGRARVECRRDRVGIPEPTRHLDAHACADRSHDRRDEIGLPVTGVARAVEVHDVQPRDAGVREPLRDCDRVVRVGGLAREVALFEPDHPPSAEVHGGEEGEPSGRTPTSTVRTDRRAGRVRAAGELCPRSVPSRLRAASSSLYRFSTLTR